MMNVDLTIITVCFNDWENCLNTINSVDHFRKFSTLQVEHVVQDGGSNDIKLHDLKKYDVKFESKDDNGIYDGMNNALRRASGRYVWFLNAGDFINEDLLIPNNILEFDESLKKDFPKITFPVFNSRFNSTYTWKNTGSVKKDAMLHHQGTIINRLICRDELIFNTEYKFRGDYDLFIRLQNFSTIQKEICICSYEGNGVSTKDSNAFTFFSEELEIDLKHGLRKQSSPAFQLSKIYFLILMRKIKRTIKNVIH